MFPGLLVIVIINVEYCDENRDLVHMPLRTAVKHIKIKIKIASTVKSLSGQMTYFLCCIDDFTINNISVSFSNLE